MCYCLDGMHLIPKLDQCRLIEHVVVVAVFMHVLHNARIEAFRRMNWDAMRFMNSLELLSTVAFCGKLMCKDIHNNADTQLEVVRDSNCCHTEHVVNCSRSQRFVHCNIRMRIETRWQKRPRLHVVRVITIEVVFTFLKVLKPDGKIIFI